MNLKKKLSVWAVVMVLLLGLGFAFIPPAKVPTPPAKAQFVLSSWDFPDEYGQGIYSIYPDENSSGYWVHIESSPGFIYSDSENNSFTIDAGLSIRFDVRVMVNYTFLGVSAADALNLIRLNLTVTVLNNITFSIQNMTYDYLGGDYGDGVWWYSFVDILNFLTDYGTIYTVTVTYEIFYSDE